MRRLAWVQALCLGLLTGGCATSTEQTFVPGFDGVYAIRHGSDNVGWIEPLNAEETGPPQRERDGLVVRLAITRNRSHLGPDWVFRAGEQSLETPDGTRKMAPESFLTVQDRRLAREIRLGAGESRIVELYFSSSRELEVLLSSRQLLLVTRIHTQAPATELEARTPYLAPGLLRQFWDPLDPSLPESVSPPMTVFEDTAMELARSVGRGPTVTFQASQASGGAPGR